MKNTIDKIRPFDFLLAFLFTLSFIPATVKGNEKQAFPIVSKGNTTSLVVVGNEPKVVHIAANMFAGDVQNITGKHPEIIREIPQKENRIIIAGTIGKSKWINKLVTEKKVNISTIKGKWESWTMQVLEKPFPGVKQALVIIGSDRRATAYGILELSRMMGVSAWEWWADVTPIHQNEIVLNMSHKTYGSPSVKYRGLFLNDEDWGLQPWAAKTFEPETGDIGPKTYAKIFELMLRLRANTIWPAMHSCTKAFYTIPGNAKTADDYAIVVGTSHCEPMLCNINEEWNSERMGEWRYDTNADTIRKLFNRRVEQTENYESIYTIGMRGKHDSPMDAKNLSEQDRIKLLEKVIADQRNMLEKDKHEKASSIPQVFIPYKEVLGYYQHGLKVPDDVTIMWTDDNYGYIRQLSTPGEQKRAGGAGIYYHASYWGRPHDYLWLSTTHPLLIWEEMHKAYQTNDHNMWILNCGDIKPMEYNIELFMDMAWNMKAFSRPDSVVNHLEKWLGDIFAPKNEKELTQIMLDYYHLCFMRRPEFMAWSQTEPVTKPQETELTQIRYGDELTRRLKDWTQLSDKVKELKSTIPADRQDAFFELVDYPVTGASLMNQKWLYHYKNEFAAQQGRTSAGQFAKASDNAYKQIKTETDYYNKGIENGKWNKMMSMAPRNLPVFSEPSFELPQPDAKASLGLALEGYQMEVNQDIPNAYSNVLPVLNEYLKDSAFVDVFLKGNGIINWTAVPQQPWIHLSVSNGTVSGNNNKGEQRIWVSIDWDKVPQRKNTDEPPLGHDYQLIPPSYKVNGSIQFVTKDTTLAIGVSVFNPKFKSLNDYKGFVEANGYVSINAGDWTARYPGKNANWKPIKHLGYSGEVMLALPYQAASISNPAQIKEQSPCLEYDFYTFNKGEANIRVQALPTHPLYKGKSVRCAVAVDEQEPVIIDFKTVGRSEEWKQNVLKNAAVKSAPQIINQPGKHKLRIWMVDPGVMVDRILIDLGGWKESYTFPPETKCRN
ncbi:hypothetical protein PbJCM13498_34850 [Prolixibacter bellariivorans]|uniref:Gylcosyl hydrolase 115 C-terminal domain-containing protein n=1 Tax=Prolixibacter bellariivorans TaxID=314319 RepID=A0A5M4B3B3_9BACT|nr:glycosyl hydrolase 115 family protein [Prolixibacter bellariivorans]GET34622.1 hypothetical protein PbJCM13498_34850 [Prolixibacter bellariivorans]